MIDPDGVGHRTFIAVGGLGRLSLAAFRLYEYAMVNRVRYGHPGLVCDDYLNAITAETRLTAMELVAAGV